MVLKVKYYCSQSAVWLLRSCKGACSNGTYTSAIGLSFTVHCSYDLLAHDTYNTSGANITDCMEQCSLTQPRWNYFGVCSKVVYDPTRGKCFFKNETQVSSFTAADLTYSTANVDTAIADPAQLAVSTVSTSCPYTNESVHNATNGYPFQIECGMDIVGYDFSDDTSQNPYYAWHHASSLQDCIDWCAKGKPLCFGVAYNADMTLGYRNCYPKSQNVSTHVNAPTTNLQRAILHASVGQINYDKASCSTGVYNATGGKSYGLTCNTLVVGDNIGLVHQDTFDKCIDYCSTYQNGSQACTIALYQPSASDGYQNCYLKAPTGNYQHYSQDGYHFAVLASSGLVATSNSTASSNAKKASGRSSKAWVAGAVIGPLVAIALIIGSLLWMRKRRQGEQMTQNQHGPVSEIDAANGRGSVYIAVPPGELENQRNDRHELPPAGQDKSGFRQYELP